MGLFDFLEVAPREVQPRDIAKLLCFYYTESMISKLREQLGDAVRENEVLAKQVNFRIGGAARYFFEARSSDEIVASVTVARALRVPFFILGGGSNVLVSDRGFDGLVIKAANRNYEVKPRVGGLTSTVFVEAGVLSAFLARKTAEAGLTGFEWAISLPGTVGGAIRGNAGCFGGEMKDVVNRVHIFNPQSPFNNSRELLKGEKGIVELNNDDCQFGYRDSVFKHKNSAAIILSAEIELRRDDPAACVARLEEKLRMRRDKQPLESSSAGCLFKNFEFSDRTEIETLLKKITVPSEFITVRRIPAAWLIDRCGLKGTRIGDVMISGRHANFVLNMGKATASDVVQLASLVKMKVHDEFGIELHEEVQLVGF